MFPGTSMVERSAVNYTAEHYKPLFWRRLATKLSPLVVPQVCPMFLAYRWVAFPFPRTPLNEAVLNEVAVERNSRNRGVDGLQRQAAKDEALDPVTVLLNTRYALYFCYVSHLFPTKTLNPAFNCYR